MKRGVSAGKHHPRYFWLFETSRGRHHPDKGSSEYSWVTVLGSCGTRPFLFPWTRHLLIPIQDQGLAESKSSCGLQPFKAQTWQIPFLVKRVICYKYLILQYIGYWISNIQSGDRYMTPENKPLTDISPSGQSLNPRFLTTRKFRGLGDYGLFLWLAQW